MGCGQMVIRAKDNCLSAFEWFPCTWRTFLVGVQESWTWWIAGRTFPDRTCNTVTGGPGDAVPGQHGFCFLGASAAFLCCVEINPGLAYSTAHRRDNCTAKKGVGGAPALSWLWLVGSLMGTILFLSPLPDIVIPGTNTSTDVQARISAGESIHIIRGTKGNSVLLKLVGRVLASAS